jgi:hypothetical protein
VGFGALFLAIMLAGFFVAGQYVQTRTTERSLQLLGRLLNAVD